MGIPISIRVIVALIGQMGMNLILNILIMMLGEKLRWNVTIILAICFVMDIVISWIFWNRWL